MKKPVSCIALLIALMTVTSAEAAHERGVRLANGKVLLLPTLSLSAYYDSNVHDTRDNQVGKKSGWGYSLTPAVGLEIDGNEWEATARAWFTLERGNKKGMDGEYWGEQISVSKWTESGWRFMLTESYRRSNDDTFYSNGDGTSFVDDRKQDTFNVNASVAKTTRSGKTTWSLGAGMTLIDYDRNVYSDSKTYSFQGQLNHRLTEKTDLVGVFILSVDDGDDLSDNSYQYTFMAGFASRAGLAKKITYRATAGLSIYDYGGLGGGTDVAPAYSLSVAWAITQKWALSALANSQYTPSETWQNVTYRWSNALTLGVNYKPTQKLDFRSDVSLRFEDNKTEAVGYNQYEYTRSYYAFRLRGNYRLSDWMSLYAAATYSMDKYNEDAMGDKDEFRVDAGVQFHY